MGFYQVTIRLENKFIVHFITLVLGVPPHHEFYWPIHKSLRSFSTLLRKETYFDFMIRPTKKNSKVDTPK